MSKRPVYQPLGLRASRWVRPGSLLLCAALLCAGVLLPPVASIAQSCCTSVVRAELDGKGGVRVAWCVGDGEGPFEAFRVVREAADNTVIIDDEIEAKLRNCIDRVPICATTNNYSVFARLPGESEWTQLNRTPRWVCTPANVTRFQARCIDTGIELSWTVTGPHAIWGFQVQCRLAGSTAWEPLHPGMLLSPSARSFIDRNARPGVKYEYALDLMSPDLGPLAAGETTVTPLATQTLQQNYPNPFNPSTTIGFTVASLDRVSIVVYDIAGRRVRELYDQAPTFVGYHEILWNGSTDSGEIAGSGVYFYRMTAPGLDTSRRMIMVR